MNKVLKRNITKLLICGGGFKFFYIVGALKYLDELNILQNINEYIGVSAGAVLSLFFNIGYTLDELDSFFLEFNFEKMLDPHIDSLLDNKGLDDGELKKFIIQHFLKNKNYHPSITFKELYEMTNKKLTFYVTNITINKLEEVNYETYPDMPIWIGIAMTTALPILYQPIIYNNNYFVDGAVFDNYPIELYSEENILGINLITNVTNIDFNIDFFNYIIKLMSMSHHWKIINKNNAFKHCTITITTNDSADMFNPDISLDIRKNRINDGYNSAVAHFTEYEFKELEELEESKESDDSEESKELEFDNIDIEKKVNEINYVV